MAGGTINLGQVAFVDKGAYSSTATYKKFNFVTTEDSCYLSLKDDNVGHAVTELTWWKCLAKGTQATDAAKKALSAADKASQEASNANSASVRAGTSALEAAKQAAAALLAKEEAAAASLDTRKMIQEGDAQISSMKAAEQALMSQALLAPSRMELVYLKRITLGNPVKQRIIAKLFPAYVLPNVFFQPSNGDSVTVNPAGELIINKVGKTQIHVIPSQNTSLFKTIEIEVTAPTMRKLSGGLRFLSGGRIRKV